MKTGRGSVWVWSVVVLGVMLVVSQYAVFLSVPDQVMGEAVKIFYVHFPIAVFSLICFILAAFWGGMYLFLGREMRYDALSASAAEVGLVFLTLTLLTGMVWARTAWGTWWTWDPRLTSVLILWLLYMGYFALRSGMDQPELRARVCAVAALLFALDIPIIHFAPRIWRGIHPVVVKTVTRIDLGHPSMFLAFFLMMATVLLLGSVVLAVRNRVALAQLEVLRLRMQGGR